MNKNELIEHVANSANLSKADAGRAVEAVTGGIAQALRKSGKLTLVNFGTFSVNKRQARTGRNPRTNQEIKIPAKNVAKFKAGKSLEEALN